MSLLGHQYHHTNEIRQNVNSIVFILDNRTILLVRIWKIYQISFVQQ